MQAVIMDRGKGKTTELVKKCAEHGGYIVVRSSLACTWAVKVAESLELQIPFPLTYQELIQGQLHGKNCSPLWIDDLDAFAAAFVSSVGAKLGGYSLSP
jgi:hypothetical protein